MARKSSVLAVGAVLATALATFTFATGASDTGSAKGAATSAAPVEISMLIDNQSTLDGIKAVATAAEKQLNIRLTINLRPGGPEGENLVKTRLVAGDMDDINFFNSGSLYLALNPAKHFLDLTNEPYMKKVIDSFKSTVSVDGKVYAAPAEAIMAGGWLYNKKVYAALGLKVPKTWAELMANCEKIKAAGKAAVIASYKDDWTSQLLVLADYYNVQAAYPKFAADYTAHKAGFSTVPAALRGFEKLQEVQKRGFLNKDPLATTYDEAMMMLLNGDGAHYPMLTFAFSNLKNLGPDKVNDIGFFAQPGETADKNGLTIWMPAGLSIYKNGKNVEAAKKWLAFYLSPEGYAAYMSAQKPSGPFAVSGVALPDDILPGVKDMLPYVDSGKTAPALEFLSPIKGPNLPQICVQTGISLKSPLESAKEYDKDVEKQAKQLGLAGW